MALIWQPRMKNLILTEFLDCHMFVKNTILFEKMWKCKILVVVDDDTIIDGKLTAHIIN